MGLGIASLCGAIWFGLPILGSGWTADPQLRAVLILSVLSVISLAAISSALRRRRAAFALEKQLLGETGGDEQVLADRMQGAVAHLKRSAGANSLYDLPWYVIIGPPGVGKTTALLHSGIEFPGADASAIRGYAGTRNCDFWFARDAVMVDTAGRYTTQDSDAAADKASWQALLRELKSVRPEQPINGVIVAFSCSDLITSTAAELAEHAQIIRDRLAEMHQAMRVPLPVYVMFTKADIIAGFREVFADLDKTGRRQVWGHTFQTRKRQSDTVGAVSGEFEDLVARTMCQVTDRLAEEPDGQSRIAILGFPEQLGLMQPRIVSFLNAVFAAPGDIQAWMRGFYFTSGTQAGTPIDQVLGAIGSASEQPGFLSGRGRSFFLHDMLTKVVFAERDWIGYDRLRVLRRNIVRGTGKTIIFATSAAIAAVLVLSFWSNATLVRSAADLSAEYRDQASIFLQKPIIEDASVLPVLAALDTARELSQIGLEQESLLPPAWNDAGLSRRQTVETTAGQVYSDGLEDLLRPRMMLLLEQRLARHVADRDLAAAYRTLRIYILTARAQPGRGDDAAIRSYFAEAWVQEFSAASAGAEYHRMNAHLGQMLARDDRVTPAVSANAELVSRARLAIGDLPEEAQLFELIRDRAGDLAPVTFGSLAGLDLTLADGQHVEAVGVPGLFAFDGYWQVLLPSSLTASDLLAENAWVLGGSVQPVDTLQLLPGVLAIYGHEMAVRWDKSLNLIIGTPDLDATVRELTAFVTRHTQLTQALHQVEAPGPAGTSLARLQDMNVAATRAMKIVEGGSAKAQIGLAPWHDLDAGQADRLIDLLETAPQSAEARARLLAQVNTLPEPLRRMVRAEFNGTITPSD